MRTLTTLNLATWSAVAVLFFAPAGLAQLEAFALPNLRQVPEPRNELLELRKELKDSRASVVPATEVTYERDADADEAGVLLANPKDAEIQPVMKEWPVSTTK